MTDQPEPSQESTPEVRRSLNVSESFAKRYRNLRPRLEARLENLKQELNRFLDQLRRDAGVRARVSESRIKNPRKLYRKAHESKIKPEDAFAEIEDVLGLRIVCNNLSDLDQVRDALRRGFSGFQYEREKDRTRRPLKSGYRAVHSVGTSPEGEKRFGVEIQVRTLAQEAWAQISRADLYGRNIPELIGRLSKNISDQLAVLDDTAQLLRDELAKPSNTAEEMDDTDLASPERLALLYQQEFGSPIYEYTLLQWTRVLRDAEIDTIGDVRSLLRDEELRERLNDISDVVRDRWLATEEIPIYTAWVATELTIDDGCAEVEKALRAEWEEVTAFARSEVLPETFAEFMKTLRGNTDEYLRVLDCIEECPGGCGYLVAVDYTTAAETVLYHYYGRVDNWPDENDKLNELLIQVLSEYVESGSAEGVCPWCSGDMDD